MSAEVIRRLHRASSLILIAFIGLHLTNHLTAVAGISAHIAFMDVARSVYRSVPGEAVLLTCVLIQMISGLFLLRSARKSSRTGWRRAQLISGAYLLFFLSVHTSAILAIRHWFDLDSNFYAAAAVLVIKPLTWFFAPYYWLGVFSFFVHIACAFRLLSLSSPATRSRVSVVAILCGAVLSTIIVLVFSGWLYPVELPDEYRQAVLQYL